MNASACFERLTAVRTLGMCAVLAAFAACGGGGDDDPAGPGTFTIGGSISGLNGTVVLQNNGGNAVTRSANGAFSFSTQLSTGTSYLVTVQTQPSGQTCSVTNAAGTANATVSNVVVTCTTLTPTIGGTVSGLSGTLVLENSQSESLAVRAGSPDFPAFTFPNSVSPGSSYSVSVLQQPPGQTCTMANASGTANNKVTNVAVTCTANTVAIGGTVSGLTGAGLVLQNNLADNLSITAAGGGSNVAFTFPAAIKSGDAYAVTVLAQPAGQVCTVTTNGSGTAVASNQNVAVNCGPFPTTITLGGKISGLTGNLTLRTIHTPQGGESQPAINTLVEENGDLPPISPIAGGSLYVVDVAQHSAGQTCVVYNYMGIANVITIGSTEITDLDVRCSSEPYYTVGGTITGLNKSGLILAMDVGGVLQIAPGTTTFTFLRRLPAGTEYRLGVLEHPAGMTCTTLNSAGEVILGNVTNVNVTCVDNVTDPLNGVYRLPGRRGYISFNPSGWYLLASHENTPLPPDPDSCGTSRGNGVELGVYDYDATAGTLAIIANRIDTNGGCGLWDGSATSGIQVQKSGVGQSSVLTLTLGTDSYTLTPPASVPGSLTGAYRQPYAYAFVVFDGTRYVVGDAGGMAEGVEYGCYTTGGGNIHASVVAATCAGAVDTNGDAGLTDVGSSSQVPYTMGSQNFLTLGTPPLEGATVWRAIPN